MEQHLFVRLPGFYPSILLQNGWESRDYNYFIFHSNNIMDYFCSFMEKEAKGSSGMYNFLHNFGAFQQFSQPGLGSQNRSQLSCNNGGTNRFNFEGNADEIIKLFQVASLPTRSVLESEQKFNDLISFLIKKLKDVADFKALQLVQLSAMFGLVPIEFSKFASLSGRNSLIHGPNQLIQLCTSNSGNEKCADDAEVHNRIFNGLCAEILKCYGNDYGGIPNYMPAKLENTMCEIW